MTLSILFGMESINRFTVTNGRVKKVFFTRLLNSSNVSHLILRSLACFRSCLLTIAKTFSITCKSGLRGGSLITVLFTRAIAAFANAEFWEGSPSCIHKRLLPEVLINKCCEVATRHVFIRLTANYSFVIRYSH